MRVFSRVSPLLSLSLLLFVSLDTTGCLCTASGVDDECRDNTPEESHGPTVSGLVTDTKGVGVPGIMVDIRDITKTSGVGVATNEGGVYRASVSPGDFEIKVREPHPGYWVPDPSGAVKRVTVTTTRSAGATPIVLGRTGRIQGVVRMVDGSPVTSSSVSCGDVDHLHACNVAFGDGPGGYRFADVAPGRYILRPAASFLALANGALQDTVSLGEQQSLDHDLVMDGGGVVNAIVKMSDGSRVAGVPVTMPSYGTQLSSATATVGFVVLHGTRQIGIAPPAGLALIPGDAAQREIQVQTGSIQEIAWTLRALGTTGALRGAVKTEAGVGIAEALVTIASGPNTRTAADGTYLFAALQPDVYKVTLTVPAGYALVPGEAAERTTTISSGFTATEDWHLRPQAAALKLVILAGDNQSALVNSTVTVAPAVRITDAQGEPVAGIAVTWSVVQGTGQFLPDQPVTGGDGIVRLTYFSPTSTGPIGLRATTGDARVFPQFVEFRLTGMPRP